MAKIGPKHHENVKNCIGKQHNKIPNLILAVITPQSIKPKKLNVTFCFVEILSLDR